MPILPASKVFLTKDFFTKDKLSLLLVVLASLPWSLTLGVLGVWLIDHRDSGGLQSPAIAISGGVAALCGAQLVFMFCIADRVFPRAKRAMTNVIEGGLGAIFLGATIVFAMGSVGMVGGS